MLLWDWCPTCLSYSEGKPNTWLRRGCNVTRLLLCVCLCGLLVAQQEEAPLHKIVTTVENVLAPVTVYDRNNNYVHGLTPDQFRIFDNNKEQNIHQVDVLLLVVVEDPELVRRQSVDVVVVTVVDGHRRQNVFYRGNDFV